MVRATMACGLWLMIGLSRFAGRNNQYQYSLFHQQFNESVCHYLFSSIIYDIFIQYAFELMGNRESIFGIAKEQCQRSLQNSNAFWSYWWIVRKFYGDFYIDIPGLPHIMVQMLKNKKKLTKFERHNFNKIQNE